MNVWEHIYRRAAAPSINLQVVLSKVTFYLILPILHRFQNFTCHFHRHVMKNPTRVFSSESFHISNMFNCGSCRDCPYHGDGVSYRIVETTAAARRTLSRCRPSYLLIQMSHSLTTKLYTHLLWPTRSKKV